MVKYPVDPEVLYYQEGRRGYVRLHRRLIDNSPNVIELQPFALMDTLEKEGEWGAQILYQHWLENGYRRTGANVDLVEEQIPHE